MEDILIKTAQLILSLSILVVLHELGHFIPAKLFNTKVEKFYLFFDPWFSLFKFKRGETEYGIGWLPLGGYVKIAGMIDESMDKEQLAKDPEPWEFRSKPAWQRLIIMVGGVTVNLLLAMFIYAMTLFTWGESYIPNKNLTDGVWCVDSLAYEMGFQTGDKILSVNNKEIEKFNEIVMELLYGGTVQVVRNNEQIEVPIPGNIIERFIDKKDKPMIFFPRTPFSVNQVPDTSSAYIAGLRAKDLIKSINNMPIKYFDQLKPILDSNANQTVAVEIEREGQLLTLNMEVSSDGRLGFAPLIYDFNDMKKAGTYEFEVKTYGVIESIPAGINKALNRLDMYVKQFQLILNPSTGAYKGIGGFASIGGMFPSVWDWQIFWEMTAFLSVILAFMNILPIPALDGGHVIFLLYEIITKRKPNEKVLEYAQMAGMIILLSLLLFANGNDILRLFR
jgi:regulator of sigma E protease